MKTLDLAAVVTERPFTVLVGGPANWYPPLGAQTIADDRQPIVEFALTNSQLHEKIESDIPDLIVLHDKMNIFWSGELEFISSLRKNGYKGVIVILTDDPSCEDLINALGAGVDEYLYLSPNLDLGAEIKRLLDQPQNPRQNLWDPDAIARMGLMRSIGLSQYEIRILIEFARDFPRLGELASRLNKSETYLRKCFSRIYAKLQDPLAIDNQAQLARFLTICLVSRPEVSCT